MKNEDKDCINQYSEIALRRVWNGEQFSWWMSNYTETDVAVMDGETFTRSMESEFTYYLNSDAGS